MDVEERNIEKGLKEMFVEGMRKLDQILNSKMSSRFITSLVYSEEQDSSIRNMNFRSTGFEPSQGNEKMQQEKFNKNKKA